MFIVMTQHDTNIWHVKCLSCLCRTVNHAFVFFFHLPLLFHTIVHCFYWKYNDVIMLNIQQSFGITVVVVTTSAEPVGIEFQLQPFRTELSEQSNTKSYVIVALYSIFVIYFNMTYTITFLDRLKRHMMLFRLRNMLPRTTTTRIHGWIKWNLPSIYGH